MEMHYFTLGEAEAVTFALVGRSIPFKYIPRTRRPMAFAGRSEKWGFAIEVTYIDAERNRDLLSGSVAWNPAEVSNG